MNAMSVINGIVVLVGIPTSIAGFVYIGRKLQVLDDLQRVAEKIKNNVKVIGDALIQSSHMDFDGDKLQAYSPIQITEKGDKYLEDTGFKKLFSEHAKDFLDCVSAENPKTNYDIEVTSIRCISLMFDKPYFDEVKNYLYNHPKDKRSAFIKIAGIYLRNRYLDLAGQKR